MQVVLDSVIERKNQDQVDGAGKPRKIVVEELHSLCEMPRRKPIVLVGQVDQRRGHDGNNPWHAESNRRGKDAYGEKDSKESFLCLPTARRPTAVEMRSNHPGQLRVNRRKMDYRIQHQKHENQLGQSGIQENPPSRAYRATVTPEPRNREPLDETMNHLAPRCR